MARILRWLAVGAAGLFLVCHAGAEPLRITTSFYPIHIATLNVTADIPGVIVTNLAPSYAGCLHEYQLLPRDMVLVARTDVLIVNGGGMESFLDKIVRSNPKLQVINTGAALVVSNTQAMAGNPHYWLSPSLHARQVEAIAEGLAAIDPVRAERYRRNGALYAARIRELAVEMRHVIHALPKKNIVTFHEAFPFFAAEFGLNVVAVVEREPGSEPSARELAETIRLVKASGVSALFVEPQYPDSSARIIARETGSNVHILDPVVTGTYDRDAYLSAMRRNLTTLAHVLR